MHLVRPVGDIFKHWMNCLSTVCFEAEDGGGVWRGAGSLQQAFCSSAD